MFIGTIAGNLGGDADIRDVGTDKVVQFSVASTTKRGGKEMTTWVRCSMWGERGVKVAQYLTKGSPVTVHGDIALREFESKGETKASLEMRVADVKLQGRKGDSNGGGYAGPSGGNQSRQQTPPDDFPVDDSDIPF